MLEHPVAAAVMRALGRWPEAALLGALAFLLIVTASAAFGDRPVGPIRIAAGQVPPQMDHDGRGRDADIIRAVLFEAYGARPVAFHVLPFSRHWSSFEGQASDVPDETERYDGVATAPDQLDLGGFVTDDYVEYRNGIIYRVADFPGGLGERPVEKLRGRRVVAFAGAAGILPDVQANVARFRSYAEYDDQYAHSELLARGAVDAVIADPTIIDFYNGQVRKDDAKAYAATLRFAPVFCPTPYHLVFTTQEMRDAFDSGLAKLRADGRLQEIDRRTNDKVSIAEVSVPNLECR